MTMDHSDMMMGEENNQAAIEDTDMVHATDMDKPMEEHDMKDGESMMSHEDHTESSHNDHNMMDHDDIKEGTDELHKGHDSDIGSHGMPMFFHTEPKITFVV